MGMFDTVTMDGKAYQTKDFECLADHYEITADGRLLVDEVEMRPGPTLSGFQSVVTGQRDTNYHGTFELHDEARSFEARFNNGALEGIR
jgi:HSP20 family molecular chaperone IbpA